MCKSFLSIVLLASCLLLWQACADPQPPESLQQRAFLIGVDVSATFAGFDTLTAEDLRGICRFVGETGGTVAFHRIGSPDDRDFRRLQLLPPPQPRSEAYSDLARWRADTAKTNRQNSTLAEAFVTGCLSDLQQRGQPETDLNGWMRKAQEILQEPAISPRERFVWMRTDGYQSVRSAGGIRDTVTRCQLLTTPATIWICGWKNPQCRPEGARPVESAQALPGLFQQYVSTQ